MMVSEPYAHGLSGHLKHTSHIVDELPILTASAELVKAPLDLSDRHKDSGDSLSSGAQHIGLHLHVIFRCLR